ncbi:hypothetical protein HZ326_11230 [Fusarium oxysporum f. sp. albedinis]|nr:hypothetical protein HZ326_11230 [Fusarium oxysporum f. sp. albedinis]
MTRQTNSLRDPDHRATPEKNRGFGHETNAHWAYDAQFDSLYVRAFAEMALAEITRLPQRRNTLSADETDLADEAIQTLPKPQSNKLAPHFSEALSLHSALVITHYTEDNHSSKCDRVSVFVSILT